MGALAEAGGGLDGDLGSVTRTPAAVGVPVGRCVQMLLHGKLDGRARAVLGEVLGARIEQPVQTQSPGGVCRTAGPVAGGRLGPDVSVVVTRQAAYCWMVSARWRDDAPVVTSAAQVRGAFRKVLAQLIR